MRTDLDHLPDVQQQELATIRQTLLDEFAVAVGQATSTSRRNAKVYKIILFGSYARNDWVDEPDKGYQSDYDLLIVVSHKDVTDIADYWYVAEDRILRDASIGRPVNIIVHSLDEVNNALTRGEYFWVDIARDGIALYELPCHPLATPMPLTPKDAFGMAKDYFDKWYPSTGEWLEMAQAAIDRGQDGDWPANAAFLLHQTVERCYCCFLLVQTLYFPRSHNIKFLRSIAEDKEPRLIDAWPRSTRLDRGRFERLKRAYVEARYSTSYVISADDLEALATSVAKLRGVVDEQCRAHLALLQAATKA